jgi:DNA-binding NarL/FixJ family response regulator
VLIVAAVRLYREGMAASLDRRDRLVVVGTAKSRVDALDLVAALSPDVVVLDMATGESVDFVRTLQLTAPEVKTVVFGVEGDEAEIIAFAQAGVAGYVPNDASLDALTSAITGVTSGDLVCPPLVAATLLRHVGTTAGARVVRTADTLTSRELEVLALIDAGLSNKEIAVRLHIEVSTVKNHVHHLLEKLQVTSRAEAAAHLGPRRTARR